MVIARSVYCATKSGAQAPVARGDEKASMPGKVIRSRGGGAYLASHPCSSLGVHLSSYNGPKCQSCTFGICGCDRANRIPEFRTTRQSRYSVRWYMKMLALMWGWTAWGTQLNNLYHYRRKYSSQSWDHSSYTHERAMLDRDVVIPSGGASGKGQTSADVGVINEHSQPSSRSVRNSIGEVTN